MEKSILSYDKNRKYRVKRFGLERIEILKKYKKKGKLLPIVEKYYKKVIPLSYIHDRIGILGVLKKIISFFISIVGLFRPVHRGPIFRHDVFEIVTKILQYNIETKKNKN